MSRQELWRVSVTVPSSMNEEPVSELLAAWFKQPASSYSDLRLGRTTVTVYLEKRPDWSRAVRQALRAAFEPAQAVSTGQVIGPRLSKLRREDWAEAWKKHFKPIAIGRRLLIQPSWSRQRPNKGQINVVLDPGMSFGTGQHPTTGFCLAELVRARRSGLSQSFLDVGTGSGILAICAAKLGYQPVHALDSDRNAVAIARANARTNAVGDSIRFQCRELASLRTGGAGQYTIVCANLLAHLLLLERDRLVALVRGGGILTLAGILKEEFRDIRTAYSRMGLRLVRSRAQGQWRSGSFLRPF